MPPTTTTSEAQRKDAISRGTALGSLNTPGVGSLQGTMTTVPPPPTYAPTPAVTPAVVTSADARKQTTVNTQQLDQIREGLVRAQQMADQLAAEEAAKKQESAVDTAIKQGVEQTGPVKSAEQTQAEQAVRDTMAQMDSLMLRMDSNAAGLIGSIQSEYAGLIRQQEELNKSYEAGITTEGFRSERARYAPLLQGQIIKAAVDGGLQKIADLQMKKNRLIMEAESARDEKQFAMLNSKMENYRAIVKEERELAQQTYESAIEASKAAREQLKFEQEQEKFSWDYANTIAPALAEEISAIKDPALRADYIKDIADRSGIDSAVLFSEVSKYTDSKSPKDTAEVKEYQFAVDQGFKGTFLDYKRTIAASTRQVNTLTAYEAANLGLPKTMVGMSEAAVQQQLNSPKIPVWFKQMNPSATQKTWDSFRITVPTTGNTIVNPFGPTE